MKTEFIETTSRFIEYCESLPNSIYFKEGDKWNTAQVMDHLERSIRPVNLAMGLPGFAHRILFGKSTRTSRSFKEVVTKYHKALEKGGKASGPYIPKGDLQNRQQNSAKLRKICQQLARRIEKRNPSDWETSILPHPLLGKLTLKEMIYFTIYHLDHHLVTLKRFNKNP